MSRTYNSQGQIPYWNRTSRPTLHSWQMKIVSRCTSPSSSYRRHKPPQLLASRPLMSSMCRNWPTRKSPRFWRLIVHLIYWSQREAYCFCRYGNEESTESRLFVLNVTSNCKSNSVKLKICSDFRQCCFYHGEIFILQSNFKNIHLMVNNSLQFSPLLQFQCKK